jgi:hypothetical protein
MIGGYCESFTSRVGMIQTAAAVDEDNWKRASDHPHMIRVSSKALKRSGNLGL